MVKKTITIDADVEIDDIFDGMTLDEIIKCLTDFDSSCADWDFTLKLLTGIMRNVEDLWDELEEYENDDVIKNFAEQLKIAYKELVDESNKLEINRNIGSVDGALTGVAIDRIG